MQKEEVLGLQIAVDDTLVVRRRETACHLHRDINRLLHWQGAVHKLGAKCLSVEQLGDDEELPIVHAGIMNREDVRVGDRGDGFRFPLQARALSGVVRDAVRQQFDGDVAIEPRVAGLVDLAHPTRAEGGENFIRSEARAGSKGQRFA